MAWEEGVQESRRKFGDINEEISATRGYINENEAKLLLYKFLYDNVSYASNLLMGVQLFPFQHITIKAMLESDYTLGVMSRGGSKSFSTAVFAGLHALFNQGVQIGIISKTFRQSKMIFKKLEDIMDKPEAQLFKDCCGKLSKGSDEWSLKVGASTIRALPLGDGEKLRGYRFHCVIIDEFLLMPEKTFNEVILPFLAVVDNPIERDELDTLENQLILEGSMKPSEKYRWQNNKLITLSSASYKFEYMYDVYQKYEAMVTGDYSNLDDRLIAAMKSDVTTGDDGLDQPDSAHRTIIHLSYDALPKALYDKDLVKQSLAQMSQSQFEREFGAVFTDDSSGFFKLSNLKKCSELDGSPDHIRIKGDPNKEYLVSFDPSWSEDEGSDDWALQVFEVNKQTGKNVVVHSYALPGQRMKTHIQYFHYILTNFNVSAIFGDHAGGTQFIRACNESKLFKDSNIELGLIETSKLNDVSTYAEGLRELKNQYNKEGKKFVYLVKFNANWIRTSNELLQTDIDRNKIRFAGLPMDADWKSEISKNIPIGDIKFKKKEGSQDGIEDDNYNDYENANIGNNAKKVDFVEHIKNMIDLTKVETASIVLTSSATGTHRFDLPPELRKQTGRNKMRRDSYTALFIGNWGCRVFRDMENPEIKQHLDFIPKFIR